MQKKLRDQDIEYEARVNEQVKKNILNQQQMEDLNRDLKTMRREIQELKTTERFKTSQIEDVCWPKVGYPRNHGPMLSGVY